MARRLVSSLAAFRGQSGGNVALMFGLAAIPVMLSVGAAVDYSLANRTKAMLDGIADATSLSAVGQSALAISAKTEQRGQILQGASRLAQARQPRQRQGQGHGHGQ